MSDDLVKRLRKNVMCGDAVIEEAADRIERLEAALRLYACNCMNKICGDYLTSFECGYRARKALEGKDD